MSGFQRGDYVRLSDLHREIREKFYHISDAEKHRMVDRWEDAPTLKNVGRSGITKFSSDCKVFSLVTLDQARKLGFNVRLVLCYTETGEAHAVCEVASTDYEEAFIFDNREIKIVTRHDLIKYRFISVSPWNPEPADSRPWLKVVKK